MVGPFGLRDYSTDLHIGTSVTGRFRVKAYDREHRTCTAGECGRGTEGVAINRHHGTKQESGHVSREQSKYRHHEYQGTRACTLSGRGLDLNGITDMKSVPDRHAF